MVRWPVSDGQGAMMTDGAHELPWESLTCLSSMLCMMVDWAGCMSKLACWMRKRACPSRVVLRCRRVVGRRHKRVRGWSRAGAVACRPLYVMRRKPSYSDRLDLVKKLLREKLAKRKTPTQSLHIWHGCSCVSAACRRFGVLAGFVGARPDSSDFCRLGLTLHKPARHKESC